jgi:prevent-host-death family protein
VRVGVAEARKRFAELLDRAMRGETVEIARRDEVIAVIGPPSPSGSTDSLAVTLNRWRQEWNVAGWPDESPFDGVRDRSEGRRPPW